MSLIKSAVTENGFAVVENVLDTNDIELLLRAIARANNSTFAKQRDRSTYAIRNALLIPLIAEYCTLSIQQLIFLTVWRGAMA